MNAKLFGLLLSLSVSLLAFTQKAQADYPGQTYVEGCEQLGNDICYNAGVVINEVAKQRQRELEYERANDPNNCSGKGCSTVGGYREPDTQRNWWEFW
jgi:DnaJ-class molecular chaperone